MTPFSRKLLLMACLGLAPMSLQTELFGAPRSTVTVQEWDNMPIQHLDIRLGAPDPERLVDIPAIRSRLQTKEKDFFSQAVFDADLKMLAESYDRVDPQIRVENQELAITLVIYPRPILEQVIFEGNLGLGRRRLERELGLTLQSPLDRKALVEGLQKVREAYIKKGYFEAQIDVNTKPSADGKGVVLVIRVREGRAGVIDKIRFVGFTREEESEALEKLNTKAWFFLTSWATKEGVYRQDAAEHDRLQVLNLLQNRGYADAKVRLNVLELTEKKKIVVEFIADKGPLYTFGVLSFKGNELFSNQEVWNIFQMRSGDPFSPERVRDTIQAFKDLYGSRGYIEAEVHYVTELDPLHPIYNVRFQITEGDSYRVGLVRIFGNEWTQPQVILRECLLIPGETFDSRRLKATERRLENIGYFKSVNVYAVKTPTRGGLGERFRDVYIEVEEDRTGKGLLTGGFETSGGLTAGLDFSERNFSLAGLTGFPSEGLRAFRGGGEYFHATVNWGTKQNNAGINWMDPYFANTLWRVGMDLSWSESSMQTNELSSVTQGLIARASYPFNPYVAFTARYRLVDEYTNVEKDGPAYRLPGSTGTISALSASFGLDTTNKPWDPTSGLRSELKCEFAGLGGTSEFFTASWLNTFYMSVFPLGTMKYRLDFNFMQPFGKTPTILQIPYQERFFLGGEQSVRGYVPFSLGPVFGMPPKPLGGLSSGLASVEWGWKIQSDWRIFAFIDAGTVTARPWSLEWPWRMSYGVGITVPVFGQAPVTVGIGIPVNPERPEDVQRYFFQMGATF